jgi:hypothetical protein
LAAKEANCVILRTNLPQIQHLGSIFAAKLFYAIGQFKYEFQGFPGGADGP